MSSSSSSQGTTRPFKGSKNSSSQNPHIKVKIDQHFKAKVYTSGSTIAGHVAVHASRDTSFDDLDIVLVGISATRLDFVQQYPSHSFRPFLKIRMPVPESHLPEDRLFRAGCRYAIPFHFVVPHHLTIGACNHGCSSPDVRERHLRLPPSLGVWDADDQAPDMTQIEYAINAKAIQRGNVGAAVKVMEAHHILKVLPSLPEDAPLDVTPGDEWYKPSKTKTIRKSLFSSKTGQFTASALQPNAVMLSADGHKSSMTNVRVNLEYAPSSAETAPPKINSVTGKLVSTTFFSAVPVDHLPNLGSRTNCQSTPCLNYTTTHSLFALPVESVSWAQRDASSQSRRDSGYSSTVAEGEASETDASRRRRRQSGKGRRGSKKPKVPTTKHATNLEIPFTVSSSNKKLFLPSFHSCLISRAYTLQLTLSVGPTNTAIALAVPLQIGVETAYEPQGDELPTFESAVAQAEGGEADAYLEPRGMRAPESELQSNTLLPGYNELGRRTMSVA
ncbi:arrestin [Trichoderma cornu-damae]|uniref:Arrestin n=1 Tax=Trichoderma cornu-damae TaxID=654480 RepID=A0A9P8QMF1_9HYPO|nr:arrestin [Trichoderma cornu-damae]